LIDIQAHFRARRSPKPKAFGAAPLLCLALLALLAMIQVAHLHPFDSDADHCPLCIAMHSAAPVAAMAVAVVLVKVGSPTPFFKVRPLIRHWHPKLFTRPPPAGRQGALHSSVSS
jgi:hypothetical protein